MKNKWTMKTLRILFICCILFVLYNYPIIEICQKKSMQKSILGYALYIFCLWGVIIAFFFKAVSQYFKSDVHD